MKSKNSTMQVLNMKRAHVKRKNICGITLIEALIGLLVLSLGGLAIARFYGDLLATAGDSKARAEAIHFVDQEIERLRNSVTLEELNSKVQATREQSTFEGRHADYLVEWSGLPENVQGGVFEPEVTIRWSDRRDREQVLRLQSTVVWSDPRFSVSAEVLDGSESGPSLNAPTGRAQMGGGELLSGEGVQIESNTIQGTQISDGTEVRIRDSEAQLVRNGVVLMTMNTTNPGQPFSTISGRVYYGESVGLDPLVTQVLSSDAGFCVRRGAEPEPEDPLQPITDTSSGYKYFWYQCYVGEGWFGNVGIVRQENANPNDRTCVGDPEGVVSSAWDSTEPRTSTNRYYRAFVNTSSGIRALGIGVSPADSENESPSYTAQHFTGHDLLITRFRSGQGQRPRDCLQALEDGEGAFQENPGRNFCLYDGAIGCGSESDGVLPPVGDTESTLVAGSITPRSQGSRHPVVNDLSFRSDFATCEVDFDSVGSGANEVTTITDYRCSIRWEGWSGDSWTSELDLDLGPNTVVCGPLNEAIGGGTVTYDGITDGKHVFTFDQINQVAELDFGFTVAHVDAGCP